LEYQLSELWLGSYKYVAVGVATYISLKAPVTGAFPAAHKILLSCWSLAVPVGLCSEYLLFKQASTDFPVGIGWGREILDSVPGVEGMGAGSVGPGAEGVRQPLNRIVTTTITEVNSAFFI
jgi:hypothetical protein